LYTLVIAERDAHEVRTIKAGRAHHENRSNAIVDILVVAGVRGITRLASIENAKSLVYAQVSVAPFFLGRSLDGTLCV
jgi:hypothetical protein